ENVGRGSSKQCQQDRADEQKLEVCRISGDSASNRSRSGTLVLPTKPNNTYRNEEKESNAGNGKVEKSIGDFETAMKFSEEGIENLGASERKKYGNLLKDKGNEYYRERSFEQAVETYTQAIKFSKDPVFYANRAACYSMMKKYEEVIEDCNEALKIDSKYIKALMRRAQAYEQVGKNQESLYDYTTACIFEDFKNNTASVGAERVLKTIAEKESAERLATRKPRLPSKSFISGYFNSFRSNGEAIKAEGTEELSEAVKEYNMSIELSIKKKYAESIEHLEKAIELGLSGAAYVEAHSLRGAYHFLKGSLELAEEDFEAALQADPKHLRTLYRKANMYTEKKDLEKVEELLMKGQNLAPTDPEAYFQLGQLSFLKQNFEEATSHYQKALDLDPTYVYPYIQLGVSQFKLLRVEDAMQTFNLAMARFPMRSDLYNYYGEVLAEQGLVVDASNAFDKSISIDKSNPLPYVNKALAMFTHPGNVQDSLVLIKDAMSVDPECELAVAALSQIYLQLGMFEDSLAMLDRAVELAKSQDELVSTITFRETTAAQYKFIKEHPDFVSRLSN
ncbi:Mitochondrial import receptor subunit tom70, partial [Zancudomyces culisetae]